VVSSSGTPYPKVVEPPNRKTLVASGRGGQGTWSFERRKPAGSMFTNFPRYGTSLNPVNGSYSSFTLCQLSVSRLRMSSFRQPGYTFKSLSSPYRSKGSTANRGGFGKAR